MMEGGVSENLCYAIMCGMDSREIRDCNYAIIGWIILLGFFAFVTWVIVPEPTAQTGSDFQWYFNSFLYFFSASAQTMGALIAIVLTAIYALVTAMKPADNPALEPTKRLMFRDPYLLGAVYLSLGSIITALFGILYVYTAGIVFIFLPFVAVVVVLLGIGGIGCLLWFLFKRGPLYINPMGLIREDVYDGKDALISNICKIDPARSINYAEICLLLQAKHRGTQYTKHTLKIIDKYFFDPEHSETISTIPDELSRTYEKFAYNVTQDLPLLNTSNKEDMSTFYSEIMETIDNDLLWEYVIDRVGEKTDYSANLKLSSIYIKLLESLLLSFEIEYSIGATRECIDIMHYPLITPFLLQDFDIFNIFILEYLALWTDFVIHLTEGIGDLYFVTSTTFVQKAIDSFKITVGFKIELGDNFDSVINNLVKISWKDVNRIIDSIINDNENDSKKIRTIIYYNKELFDKIYSLPEIKLEKINKLLIHEDRSQLIVNYSDISRIVRTLLYLPVETNFASSGTIKAFKTNFDYYSRAIAIYYPNETELTKEILNKLNEYNKNIKINIVLKSTMFGYNYPLEPAIKVFKFLFDNLNENNEIKEKIINDYAIVKGLSAEYVNYGMNMRERINKIFQKRF